MRRDTGLFAVFDVETTGFDAFGRDRVVEIAVVHLDEALQPVAEFTSLVNPERDTGPSHIHRITDDLVEPAPVFAELAHLVVAQLAGRVLVAHNAPFDLRFIQAEFRRIGHQMPQSNTVDTYRLTGCKLEVACERFGITNDLAHSALGDAHATARVLRAVVDHHYEGVVPDGWLGAAAEANPAVWPVIEPPRDARPPLSRVPRA